MITKPWGEFIGMDDETRQRFRFDVARVKISTSVRDAIDIVVSIMVQGVEYEVRAMEEGGGSLEFVHFTREEDQLGWSAAVSSCDSVGRRPAAAVVEGPNSDGFESDGTEEDQFETTGAVQEVHGNRENISLLKENPNETFEKSVLGLPFPSKDIGEKTNNDDNTTQVIRGLSTSQCGDQGVGADRGVKVDQGEGSILVGSSKKKEMFLKSSRPMCRATVQSPIASPIFSVSGPFPNPVINQVRGNDELGDGPGVTMVEQLDDLLLATSGNISDKSFKEDRQVESSLSSPSSLSEKEITNKKGTISHRKTLARIHFPHFGGPKCLRLMEAVSNGGAFSKREKIGDQDSHKVIIKEAEEVLTTVAESIESEDNELQPVEGVSGSSVDCQLEVVLPFENPPGQNSGVNLLLCEEDLIAVEEFQVRRRDPVAKRLEAEELLQIQSDLGMTVGGREQNILTREIEHEDRDRERFEDCEELLGDQ
ncbi:hypothetical protein P8452_15065 [Trifolium repens]|nr:hypothetical protein P8452_15065 [Trifolium repens]